MTAGATIATSVDVAVAPSLKHITVDAIVTIFAIASTAVLKSFDSTSSVVAIAIVSTTSATAVSIMSTPRRLRSSAVAGDFKFVAVWQRSRCWPHFASMITIGEVGGGGADLTRMMVVSIRLVAAAAAGVTNRDGTAITLTTIKKVGGKVEAVAG